MRICRAGVVHGATWAGPAAPAGRARPAGAGAPLFALAAGCCRWGAVHVPRRVAVAAVARARRVAVGGGVGRWDPAHDPSPLPRPWHSEYNSTHYSIRYSPRRTRLYYKRFNLWSVGTDMYCKGSLDANT